MWAVMDTMTVTGPNGQWADAAGHVWTRRAWQGRTFRTQASAQRFVMSMPRHLRAGAMVVRVSRTGH